MTRPSIAKVRVEQAGADERDGNRKSSNHVAQNHRGGWTTREDQASISACLQMDLAKDPLSI